MEMGSPDQRFVRKQSYQYTEYSGLYFHVSET